jgi:hypothetical protein
MRRFLGIVKGRSGWYRSYNSVVGSIDESPAIPYVDPDTVKVGVATSTVG